MRSEIKKAVVMRSEIKKAIRGLEEVEGRCPDTPLESDYAEAVKNALEVLRRTMALEASVRILKVLGDALEAACTLDAHRGPDVLEAALEGFETVARQLKGATWHS